MAKKPIEQRTHGASAKNRREPGMARTCTHPAREARRAMAAKRVEAWQKLTLSQQLEELKARPGKCEKQIARLTAPKKNVPIESSSVTPEVQVEAKKTPARTDLKAQKAKKRREAAQAQS